MAGRTSEAGRRFRGLDPVAGARMASYAEALARDGAVHIPGALNSEDFAIARRMLDWGLANPGPSLMSTPMEDGPPIRVDAYNRAGREFYNEMLAESTMPAIVAAVMGLDELWYLGEQIFVKDGPEKNCATPWHQDYTQPVETHGLVGLWIAFESLDRQSCLNFVRGSHRGPTYNPTVPSGDRETVELYYPTATDMPPFPDIDANRRDYDIISWNFEPGDVILFNNMTIHGGAVIPAGGKRHTLSLRFCGPDVRTESRPPHRSSGKIVAKTSAYLYEDLREGMRLSEGKHFSQVFDHHNATYAS